MLWINDPAGGMASVIAATTNGPVRLIVQTLSGNDWATPEEIRVKDLDEAKMALDDLGTRVEDIILLFCEGVRPEDIGFAEAY